ncbi:hypothetical protein V2J09_010668 [Rumex salicifolius]
MDHNDKLKLPFPFNFPPEPPSSSFLLSSVDNSVNFPLSRFQFDSPTEIGGGAKSDPFAVPQPLDCFQGNLVPPFLSKTYDLVDDPLLDHIISWGERGNSFVVWEPDDFSSIVLPRNFKHANFSSFIRQLNTYVPIVNNLRVYNAIQGFRKIDAGKWEFANEFFLQGSKHLLKNIHRRRPRQPHHQVSVGESSGLAMDTEVGKLKLEKTMMMQEMAELQQQNRETAERVKSIKGRLQASEQRQKQMVSFVAKTVQNPDFIEHLVEMKEQRFLGCTLKTQEQGGEQIEFKPELPDSLHQNVNVSSDAPIPVRIGGSGVSTIQHGYLVDFPEELETDKGFTELAAEVISEESLGMDDSWRNVGGCILPANRQFFSGGFSDAWDLSGIQEEEEEEEEGGSIEVEKRIFDESLVGGCWE